MRGGKPENSELGRSVFPHIAAPVKLKSPDFGDALPLPSGAEMRDYMDTALDTVERGRVKRAPGFRSEVLHFAGTQLAPARLSDLLRRGRARLGLGRTDAQVLTLLVDVIHADRWRKGSPIARMTNGEIAHRLAISVRAVQLALARLESSGWLIRAYDQRNQRAGEVGGITLAPTGARIAEIIAAAEEHAAERRARYAPSPGSPRLSAGEACLDASTCAGGDESTAPITPTHNTKRDYIPCGHARQAGRAPPPERSGPKPHAAPPPLIADQVALIASALPEAAAAVTGLPASADPRRFVFMGARQAALAAGVPADDIELARLRLGELAIAARLAAALTLPGARSVVAVCRAALRASAWDSWGALYARAREGRAQDKPAAPASPGGAARPSPRAGLTRVGALRRLDALAPLGSRLRGG